METETTRVIAAYIAVAVPATVAIANASKIILEWLNQRHTLRSADVESAHKITTHYLDRALDPNVPLAIRQQLLRFLATPDKAGSRMRDWARSELVRVEIVVDATDRAVVEAEKALLAAKTKGEVEVAENKLAIANSKKQSLLDAPKPTPITPAALRAGLISEQNLSGLNFPDSDLSGIYLVFRNLRGSDLSRCTISDGNFQGSDLRQVNFSDATLTEVRFFGTDLRGANFQNAKIVDCFLQQALLEGADFTGAVLKRSDLRARYDSTTKWPVGFDPVKHGAVLVDGAS